MKLLLKNATIYFPDSPYHLEQRDIFIKKGRIDKIGSLPEAGSGVRTIESENLCISPGWVDIGTQTGDPGYEHREDLDSVTMAARAGGFTALLPHPNTNPVIHSKSEVQYILRQTQGGIVDFYPIGAITRHTEGRDITEMYDMHESGAVAFGDGRKSIQHGGVLLRALQYVKPINGVVVHRANDETVAGGGQMHEGKMSTILGMRGIPSLAEDLMIQRDLSILEYAASRLHFYNISTKGAVALIRQAQKNGLQVTASIAAMQLAFDDSSLENFDTNLKVMPPLRESDDIEALKKGLKQGVISCINSNHEPYEVEKKNLEFSYAAFGAIGLETAFATACSQLQSVLTVAQLVEKFAIQPRRIFNLEMPVLEEGRAANLTVFDPGLEWTFSGRDIFSKSDNTPFAGTTFKGKALGIINNGQAYLP